MKKRTETLTQERMVAQRERAYPVMAFAPGDGKDPAYIHPRLEEELLFFAGPLLVKGKDPVARVECSRQVARLKKVVSVGGTDEVPALARWQAAMAEYGHAVEVV